MRTKRVKPEFPKDVTEFVVSNWYNKVVTLVSNFHLNEPIEDTMGDIICELLEKKYLERWEPSCGSYSNWLYTFTSNICRKKWNRSHTEGGSAIEGACSLAAPSSDDSIDPSTRDEERLNTEDSAETESIGDYNLLCEEIERVLSAYPAHSSNTTEDGVVYNRDMKTTFQLLKQDLDPKEIAELFGTSVEFVYTLVRKMRPILKAALGDSISTQLA